MSLNARLGQKSPVLMVEYPLSPQTCEMGKDLIDKAYCCLDLIVALQYQSNGRDPSCPVW